MSEKSAFGAYLIAAGVMCLFALLTVGLVVYALYRLVAR